MTAKRIQNLEARVAELSSIVDQLTLAIARNAPGSNVRIVKSTTSGSYPVAGQNFEIEFQDGTYVEAAANDPAYTKRFPLNKWCSNVSGTLPGQGNYMLAWWIGDRWWTFTATADIWVRAITDEEIQPGTQGNVTPQDGQTIGEQVWLDWLHGGQSVGKGRQVLVMYSQFEAKWRIVSAECEGTYDYTYDNTYA